APRDRDQRTRRRSLRRKGMQRRPVAGARGARLEQRRHASHGCTCLKRRDLDRVRRRRHHDAGRTWGNSVSLADRHRAQHVDAPAGPVDLVMPVYNEMRELPAVLGSLARQVDASGAPLARGMFRIIAVNNASTDGSRDLLETWASAADGPELIVLDEPRKSHVLARALGASFALAETNRPLIVHA